jgi:hypothetical protein
MRGLLLRLYPARWRARYGDEFELVLTDRPLGPFDVADVLLGALDAHLHLRGLGAASAHGKGFAMTLRIGGYAAILGGLLWFIVLAGNAINNGGEAGAWLGWSILAAVVTTLVALVGLSAFQARRYPVLIWTSFAVPAISGVISLLGAVAIAASGDSDREIVAGLSGWAIAMIGVMGLLVGSGLFALGTWRARSLSRPAAALLGLGAVVVVFTLAGVSGGFMPRELTLVALVTAILAFPGGWAALGLSALRVGRAGTVPMEGAVL